MCFTCEISHVNFHMRNFTWKLIMSIWFSNVKFHAIFLMWFFKRGITVRERSLIVISHLDSQFPTFENTNIVLKRFTCAFIHVISQMWNVICDISRIKVTCDFHTWFWNFTCESLGVPIEIFRKVAYVSWPALAHFWPEVSFLMNRIKYHLGVGIQQCRIVDWMTAQHLTVICLFGPKYSLYRIWHSILNPILNTHRQPICSYVQLAHLAGVSAFTASHTITIFSSAVLVL